jgi:hypothetical protein
MDLERMFCEVCRCAEIYECVLIERLEIERLRDWKNVQMTS